MKKKFSIKWNQSKQRRKQRKYRHNAPLHIKRKFLGARLSKELREKEGIKTLPVRTGDEVKIFKGQFKGKRGKVNRTDIKRAKVYVEGIEINKKDGSKTNYPVHASNLIITHLDLSDKRRIKSKKESQAREKTKKETTNEKKKTEPKKQEKQMKKEKEKGTKNEDKTEIKTGKREKSKA